MNIARTLGAAGAALGMACLGAAVPAHAQVFSSGPASGLGGSEATAWIQANEFDLTTPTDLGSLEFSDLEEAGSYQGSVDWTIYANGSGDVPGAVIASGDTSDVARAATGEAGYGLTEFTDTFSLGSVSLAAGGYWLGLHNGPLTTSALDGFYWASAAPSATLAPGQQELVGTAGGFASNDTSHAFTLSAAPPAAGGTFSPASVAVPEPSAFALMGLALFPLAVVARRSLSRLPQ